MRILDRITGRQEDKLRAEVQHLSGTIRALRAEVAHSILLTNQGESSSSYTGNPYNTYKAAVEALAEKYEGIASWGCQGVKNLIDIRAAFTIGPGVKPVINKNPSGEDTEAWGQRELEYIERFMEENDLDEELPIELAREAEIEGKVAAILVSEEDRDIPMVRHIPWSTYKYKVITDANDYKKTEKLIYTPRQKAAGDESNTTVEGDEVALSPDAFIYKKFGGRTTKVNESLPKMAYVLRHVEDLDKALWDFRAMNHLYSAPTPHLQVETNQDVEDMQRQVDQYNWVLGKFLISVGTFNLVEPTGKGAESIRKEIVVLSKIISGTTGIPVHFLGFTDLMSNRATAENLLELIVASVGAERKVWTGFYEELFRKVLVRANSRAGQAGRYNLTAIGAELPQLSNQKLKELKEVWLPMFEGGTLSLETFLRMVPNVDVEEEMELLSKEKQDRLQEMRQSMAAQGSEGEEPSGGGSQSGGLRVAAGGGGQ